MKVLFSHSLPFFLAHGGSQTLIEALMRELRNLGVEAEPARWWDERQTSDILHYVGRPNILHVRLAHKKGFKVVVTDLLDQPASRSGPRQFFQRSFKQVFGRVLLRYTSQFSWEVYRESDALVFAVPHEWTTAKYLFEADPTRGHVIPHGLEDEALNALAQPQSEEDYLVSIATIDARKNSVLLAETARRAEVPIVFIGKPYAEDDPYFRRFRDLIDNRFVRYAGFVSSEEKYRLLRGARGFALLSQYESGCIAVFEAAAAGLPLFLPDKPWATKSYPGARAIRFTELTTAVKVAPTLRKFYTEAHRQSVMTFEVYNWREIARRYREIYASILGK